MIKNIIKNIKKIITYFFKNLLKWLNYNLLKILIVFFIGLSTRFLVNYCLDVNVFVDYLNITSIIYYLNMSSVMVYINQYNFSFSYLNSLFWKNIFKQDKDNSRYISKLDAIKSIIYDFINKEGRKIPMNWEGYPSIDASKKGLTLFMNTDGQANPGQNQTITGEQGTAQQGTAQQGNTQQGNTQQGNVQQGTAQQGNVQQGGGRGRISIADVLNPVRDRISLSDILNPSRTDVQREGSNTQQSSVQQQDSNTQQHVVQQDNIQQHVVQQDNIQQHVVQQASITRGNFSNYVAQDPQEESSNAQQERSNAQQGTIPEVLKAGRKNGPIQVDSSSNPDYTFKPWVGTHQPLMGEIARALDIQSDLGVRRLNNSIFSYEQKRYLKRYLFTHQSALYNTLQRKSDGDIDWAKVDNTQAFRDLLRMAR